MNELDIPDPAWREAVAAIDAGQLDALHDQLAARPQLARERLEAGDGYFARPYLLWFVAENPVRRGRLPPNIVEIARALVEAARGAGTLAAQIDQALALVCTGRVPRECGVQRALIDLFASAGADLDAALRAALPHRELEAAAHLLALGARRTLLVAAALGEVEEVLARGASSGARERHDALMCAAVVGQPAAIGALISLGVELDAYGAPGFHPHSTALHQAVDAGVLPSVQLLVEAGADATARDLIYDGTPLGWAQHLHRAEIADYLRRRR
ncbi:MAG: hypothetical protein ACTHU0_25030 [Kofleriaceae bacterium]